MSHSGNARGIFLACLVVAVPAAACDCTIWPWDKECSDVCSASMLGNIDVKEMVTIVGLDEALAVKIDTVDSSLARSFKYYERYLDEREIGELKRGLAGLKGHEALYLGLPEEERREFAEELVVTAESPLVTVPDVDRKD